MRTTKKLYQWDTDQKLIDCVGKYVDYPIGDEVYRIEVIDKECIIPDELLQVSGTVKVYECMEYGTVKAFAFYINPRPMPPDYVFTPTQRLTFEGLVKKVDETIEDLQKRADSGEFNGSDYVITESDYDAIAAKTADKLQPTIGELARTLETEKTDRERADISLQKDISGKLSEPVEGLAVGKYFRVAQIDENGHAVLEAVDAKTIGVQDVRVNGNSIVADKNGVADMPIADRQNVLGLVKVGSVVNGIGITADGSLAIDGAINTYIDNRQSRRPITPINLDYAVKAAMCDGKGAAWTAEEQATAQERLGVTDEFNSINTSVGELKGDLSKFFVDNNTPSLTIEENKYIDYNNGRATSNTAGSPKSVSGIVVPCNAAIKIVLKYVPLGGDRGFALYDENNKFLKGYGYTPNVLEYSVVTPSKARYLAITSFDYDYKVIQFDGNSLSNTLSSIFDNDYESEQLNKYFDIDNNELYDSTYYAIRKLYVLEGETLKINTHGFTHNSAGIGFFCSRGMGLISKHRITESIFELTVPNRADYVLISYRQAFGIDIEIDVKKQAFIKNPYQNYPLSKLDMSPTFITMFRKIVCIGDSLTQGEFDVTSGSNKFPQFSWVAQMGKMTGVPCVNLGIGSHSASRSATYPWLKTALQESGAIASPFETTDFTENPADAYIIALGTNDIGNLGSFTGDLSTDINDADYLQNAHTSVGGYAEIIQRILEMQPKAKIFCVTIPQTRNNATTRLEANTKIKSIASKFGCYIIDLETYGEGEKGDYKDFYKNSSHSNALGHNLRAREYIAYIDWIVENNLDDFRNVQFIGSNSDWVKS